MSKVAAIEPTPRNGELVPLFVRTEKNLVALGFFTPTSKRVKDPREKVIRFKRASASGTVEGSIRIVTAGRYGLPSTSDLDKYLALQFIINNIQQRAGAIRNPVSFTSTELLKVLGHQDSGKNYRLVDGWLGRMYATTIEATGVGIFFGEKRRSKERNRVFERVVSVGKELERGVIAERNYIWLADWQLESLNGNFTVPVDFAVYRLLRNPIAKILVPLLQIWLYASRDAGFFEKGYGELCQLLGVEQYQSPSQIRQKLGPALDELTKFAYLKDWRIEGRKRGEGFKVILAHGEKFWRDLARQAVSDNAPKQLTGGEDDVLELLHARGLTKANARKLLRERAPDQSPDLMADQIEFIDHLIADKPIGHFRNPPGLYYRLLKDNIPIPPTFETGRLRKQREALAREALAAQQSEYELSLAYDAYRRDEIARHIAGLDRAVYAELIAQARATFSTQHKEAAKVFGETATMAVVTDMVERQVAGEVPLLTLDEFRRQQPKVNSA